MDAYSFAHLSDPHLPLPPERPMLRDLMSKRLASWLSWRRRRCGVHLPRVLAALLDDVAAHSPDHRVITGDLANIALESEFSLGRDWLAQVGPPRDVTLIPGNHDTLVPVPWDRGLGLWRDWMAGDGAEAAGAGVDAAGADLFPAVRVRGPVAFIGLNSGLPTPYGSARGTLGPAQIAAAERVLADLGRRGLFRVVLVHHPVADGVVGARKALTDRAALRAVIRRVGAELLLHGHAHHAHMGTVAGPAGPVPTLTVPSASAIRAGHYDAARWTLVQVRREGARWRAVLTVRGYGDCQAGGFTTLARLDLLLPVGAGQA
ncbi:MAG: hypothetical protein RLY86_73 [Pseudomonadota bacterium]|jgi:3',5'-cyclic AMP phosphodiesterase CpdA